MYIRYVQIFSCFGKLCSWIGYSQQLNCVNHFHFKLYAKRQSFLAYMYEIYELSHHCVYQVYCIKIENIFLCENICRYAFKLDNKGVHIIQKNLLLNYISDFFFSSLLVLKISLNKRRGNGVVKPKKKKKNRSLY